MDEITSTRTNALIDPALHVWHGEVAVYLFLGGLVAGLMVLAGLGVLVRPGKRRSTALSLLPWAAPLLLSLGMLFLWLDLENPWNAFRFYLVFRPASPMSWGAWILLAIYPASIALAWLTSPEALRRRFLGRLERLRPGWEERVGGLGAALEGRATAVAVANVVLGAALGVYTGLLLGTMAARPLWSSAILGPLFLVSGLSTGAAFMLLYGLDDRERVLLSRVDVGLILAELALVGMWLTGLVTGGAESRAAAGTLLGGPYTTAFWTLVVALGLVAPLVVDGLEERHRRVPGRMAAMLVLVGGLALRWIVVYAGQEVALGGALVALP